MTGKIYKTAMGKTIDLGALMLENENTRAVGNMKVNARGDLLDADNRVIEPKARQVQKQYAKQQSKASESATMPVAASTRSARARKTREAEAEETDAAALDTIEAPPIGTAPSAEPTEPSTAAVPRGGLAAAIARSRELQQELIKTPRQLAQQQAGVKKI